MNRLHSGGAGLAAFLLMLNAFSWGVSWWPLRHLQSHGLHPLWATALMYGLITAGLLLVRFRAAWGGLRAHPALWLLAVISGFTNLGFNWAITVGDVVRVVLLFYLMPAWSVLAAWLLLGEKPTWGAIARLLLAMAGVLIVLKTPDVQWPVPQDLADWLALTSGLAFAINNALLRRYSYTPVPARMLAMFGGSAAMAFLAALLAMQWGAGLGLPAVPGFALAPAGIPVLLVLTACFALGNMALQYAAARLAAASMALVMLTEIVFASASSALLGAGDITPRTLVGGGLIVLAAVLAALASGGGDGSSGGNSSGSKDKAIPLA